MIDRAAHELHGVPVADPRQEMARGRRPIIGAERPDAQAGNGKTVLVGIQSSQRFPEHFRYTVPAVGAGHDGVVDHPVAPMKADRVIGAGEYHSLHARAARRLENVVAAFDVQAADAVPAVLIGNAREVHDTINAVHRAASWMGSLMSALTTSSPGPAGSCA